MYTITLIRMHMYNNTNARASVQCMFGIQLEKEWGSAAVPIIYRKCMLVSLCVPVCALVLVLGSAAITTMYRKCMLVCSRTAGLCLVLLICACACACACARTCACIFFLFCVSGYVFVLFVVRKCGCANHVS